MSLSISLNMILFVLFVRSIQHMRGWRRWWYICALPPLSLLRSIRLHRVHVLIESPCLCSAIQRRYLAGVGTSRSRNEPESKRESSRSCVGLCMRRKTVRWWHGKENWWRSLWWWRMEEDIRWRSWQRVWSVDGGGSGKGGRGSEALRQRRRRREELGIFFMFFFVFFFTIKTNLV